MQESPEAMGSRIRWATTKQDLESIKGGVGLILGEHPVLFWPCFQIFHDHWVEKMMRLKKPQGSVP